MLVFEKLSLTIVAWLTLTLTLPAGAEPGKTSGAAPGPTVATQQVRAELLAHAPEGIAPGKALQLGLLLRHQPHWHTYWKNPGDSGLPTLLEWTLPAGVTAGPIQWPTPSKLPIGPLLNYGYEDTVLLPVDVHVPADFSADALPVALHAEWLVCKEVCIPQSGDFAISIPARAATAGDTAAFEAARAAQPLPAANAKGTAELHGDTLVVHVAGLPGGWQGRPLALLPEVAGVVQNAAAPVAAWDAGTWTARLAVDPQRSVGPALLPVVLTTAGQRTGLRVDIAVTSAWPAVVAPLPLPALVSGSNGGSSNATADSAAAADRTAAENGDGGDRGGGAPAPPPAGGFVAAVALALLGGALLNLMPCVFPVLSLKVLGFATQAHDRRALLASGFAYAAGVVLSFVALAALLLGLRAGGEQLGWGFQLQSPTVVAALAALFTLIGLNLAGVFDIGGTLPGNLATARARHPLADSALTGVLAVAVASPCTAPFMGASLGAAVTLPTVQALAVFAALGVGMALPTLLASAWPRLANALPRPGVWMAHFKTVMAFPMFATVVWLVWVVGMQSGVDGAAALLAALVALSFAAWALGSPALGRRARRGFGAVSLVLLAAAVGWALPALRADAQTPAETAGATSAVSQTSPGSWEPWSSARVAELSALGRPVFVDFTAAWCVTCQVNKRTVLHRAEVRADFERHGVVLLRADWTLRDAAISAELARLRRSGVPVYALYAPGAAAPRLLSEVLSVGEVRAALAALPSRAVTAPTEPVTAAAGTALRAE